MVIANSTSADTNISWYYQRKVGKRVVSNDSIQLMVSLKKPQSAHKMIDFVKNDSRGHKSDEIIFLIAN